MPLGRGAGSAHSRTGSRTSLPASMPPVIPQTAGEAGGATAGAGTGGGGGELVKAVFDYVAQVGDSVIGISPVLLGRLHFGAGQIYLVTTNEIASFCWGIARREI